MVPSFVLGSRRSSTYPWGYASGPLSPAASPENHFEHPIECTETSSPLLAQDLLDVQVSDFQRMLLNEVASGLHFVAHENRKNFVDAGHVLEFDAQ